MTAHSIFVINTGIVWLAGFLAVWRAPRCGFPTAAMAGVVLVNGVEHAAQALMSLSYNPGLLTGVAVFIPVAAFTLVSLRAAHLVSTPQLVAAVVWGALAHAILVAGILAANVYQFINETAYLIILIFWASLPTPLSAFVFTRNHGIS